MSTLKVTALKNPSSSANNIVLNTDGSITLNNVLVSNTYLTGTYTSNNYIQAQGYGTGDVSNNYLQSQLSGGGIEIVAAGRFTSAGATTKASNLSCTRTTTGSYTLTFGTARPTSTYIIQGQIIEPSSTSDDVKIHVLDGSQTTSSFQVRIYEGDNGGTADVLRDRNFYITVVDF